ncbi:MAG: ABC transporter substrate-binding protein [Deltaproteobacteria bacterium]|jgi:iron complex transport system substrate-binding protein|nr:ABC transporter substrate-binding protein [Deltaproteobacteria bacterium]
MIFFTRILLISASLRLLLLLAFSFSGGELYARTITDMRGIKVDIPDLVTRVATVDDGFVEGVMTHLGVIDKTAAIGSWSMKRDYRYDYESVTGEKFRYEGLNTMKFLHPWLDYLPCFNSPQGDVLNFETLAKANPELVIIRVGDCTVGATEKEKIQGILEILESLGIPAVVLYAPGYYRTAELSTIKEEMRVLGDVFGQREKALALYDYLHAAELLARERTRGVPEESKASVLYLGLNPDLRKAGSLAGVFGLNTPESYVVEDIVNARTAFRGVGRGVPLNLEKLYALDPDVIILPTYNGYHPPRELYEAPYFQSLGELKAVRNKRVYSLPWTPMNCARRLEYPIDILITAKAAYPDLFDDLKLKDHVLELYGHLYGAGPKTARGLKSTQLLDWLDEYDF